MVPSSTRRAVLLINNRRNAIHRRRWRDDVGAALRRQSRTAGNRDADSQREKWNDFNNSYSRIGGDRPMHAHTLTRTLHKEGCSASDAAKCTLIKDKMMTFRYRRSKAVLQRWAGPAGLGWGEDRCWKMINTSAVICTSIVTFVLWSHSTAPVYWNKKINLTSSHHGINLRIMNALTYIESMALKNELNTLDSGRFVWRSLSLWGKCVENVEKMATNSYWLTFSARVSRRFAEDCG